MVGATPEGGPGAAILAFYQLHAATRTGGAPVFPLEGHREQRGLLLGRALSDEVQQPGAILGVDAVGLGEDQRIRSEGRALT